VRERKRERERKKQREIDTCLNVISANKAFFVGFFFVKSPIIFSRFFEY